VDTLDVHTLLETPTVELHDVYCPGLPVEPTEDEFTSDLRLVFPYRGVFVRHVGDDQAVAEPNQVLFFNAGERYRISHPVPGGDACLSLGISEALLRELTPPALLRGGLSFVFALQRLRIDPRAQALVALLRHSTQRNIAETLEAEGLTLTLVMRALGPRTAGVHASAAPAGRSRQGGAGLRSRAALDAGGNRGRGRPLAGLPDPGVPAGRGSAALSLSTPHASGARARSARPVRRTTLGLDLGFSSHSHFTSAFTQAYGRSPSEFRQAVLRRS
jgi:AraC family transcriptional regulator